MAGIEDLINIYRGESIHLNPFRNRSSSLYNEFGRTRVGRYATTSAAEAANYATRNFPNVIKTTKITPNELKVGKRVYHEMEPHFTDDGVKAKRIRKTLKDVTENLNRNYNILSKNKMFDEAPEFLRDGDIEIEYVSPLAKAQRSTDVQSLLRMVELTQPLSQIDPSVMDYVDMDGLVKHLIKVLSIPSVAVRGDEQVAQLRQQRQEAQEQQAEMMAQQQQMEAMGKAAPMVQAMNEGAPQ